MTLTQTSSVHYVDDISSGVAALQSWVGQSSCGLLLNFGMCDLLWSKCGCDFTPSRGVHLLTGEEGAEGAESCTGRVPAVSSASPLHVCVQSVMCLNPKPLFFFWYCSS